MKRIVHRSALLLGVILAASCTSSGGGSSGTLTFDEQTYSVTSGSTTPVTLTLSGSTATAGVTATIASSGSSVAVPLKTSCVLSDESGSTSSCQIQLRGLAPGIATLRASAQGLSGASASVTVSGAPVPGTLTMTPPSETVVANSFQRVVLALAGSSGMTSQGIDVATSNAAIATVSPTRCALSTDEPSCTLTVTGVAPGVASVSATATGYATATNAVTVTGSGVVAGTLAFGGNVQVAVNGKVPATLTLVGSSNVPPFTATITLQNAMVSVSQTACTLSTAAPTCHLTVTGVSAGSDRIAAAATGYTGASMIATVPSAPVPGNLHFAQPSETVSVDATANVTLLYSGGSGVASVPVTITTSNADATVQPTTCNLNNLTGGSSCTLTVTGRNVGATTLTASASGYANALNEVTVQQSSHVGYGTLAFSPLNASIAAGTPVPLTLQLQGSTNVDALPVAIAASPAGVVTLDRTTCTLSTTNPTCTVTATGVALGTATVSTTSQGPASQASAAVTVDPAAQPALLFSPSPLVLSSGSVAGSTVTLTLANPPATGSLTMIIHYSDTLAESITPDPCVLSAATPTCSLAINNSSTSNAPGQYWLTASPGLDPEFNVAYATLPVFIADPLPTPRTLKVVNNCPYDVYAGISGGAVASVVPVAVSSSSSCPSGTTPTVISPDTWCCPIGSTAAVTGGGMQCFWNNPVPTNGYLLTAANPSTLFKIPADSYTTAAGLTDVWSGTLMGRLGCDANGNCAIGTCNGNTNCPTGGCTGGTSLACAVGTGFQSPATVAEFTLERGQADAYDVQIITGVAVPTSMGPTTLGRDPSNPYTAGVAGSASTQAGALYTLNAATWQFTPPSIGTPASATYFALVGAIAGDTDGCSDADPCTAPDVCGYAQNSIQALTSMPTSAPTYKRACGPFLAWLSADAVWKGNADQTASQTNVSPFDFYSQPAPGPQSPTTPYPNTLGYSLWQFVDCPNPPMQSGYQPATTYPYACGCTDWTDVATPTTTCQGTGVTDYDASTPGIGFNSAWLGSVLPLLSWLKEGCPTCYTYQFDDASSSFGAYSPAQQSNASNGTNYTITFCPNTSSLR